MLIFPIFSVLALWELETLFGNFIKGLSWRDCGSLAFAAYLSVLAAVFAAWIIEVRGPERFGSGWEPNRLVLPGVGRLFRLIAVLAPLTVQVPAILTSSSSPVRSALASLAGAVAAVLVALFGWILYHRLPRSLNLLRRLMLWITARLGPGYFEDDEAQSNREPYPEHVLSLSFFIVLFVGYVGIGYLKMTHVGEPTGFTTAAYLCISLTLLTTTLSGITFALDRWLGVASAITVVAVAVILLFPAWGLTDHYFDPGDPVTAPFPAAATLLEDGAPRIFVVAAAGGGIQAAAWTATVLTRLDQAVPQFRGLLRAISGVSGGSVGGMYYLTSFPGSSLSDEKAEAVRQQAMAGSLDEITAGLTFYEVLRIPLASFSRFRLLDRGLAMESTFAARSQLGSVSLADWAAETGPGRRPAIILNSVEVETGWPVLFSTTQIRSSFEQEQLGSEREVNLFRLGPSGIKIPTAVRLSASFPFVTPVARPLGDASETSIGRLHLADGGYYDNFGVTAPAHWLNDALESSSQLPAKVLLLQIRSFPPGHRKHPLRSFLFQYYAPLTTLLSVREEAPRIRNQEYLRVLRGYWKRNGRSVKIQLATIDFLPEEMSRCARREPPLSWRLREDQKECIAEVWNARRSEAIAAVEGFLQ